MTELQSKGLNGLELDVAIIGAGMGNLFALCCMREKLGLNVQSFDLDMFQNWKWSERYARQSEVLAYLNAVADKNDLKYMGGMSAYMTEMNAIRDDNYRGFKVG